MKTKTSELIGIALDWAVAKCEGYTSDSYMRSTYIKTDVNNKPLGIQVPKDYEYIWFNPSTNWAIAGPIIERELLQINPAFHNDTASVSPKWEKYGFRSIAGWHWVAYVLGSNNIDENYESLGDTPLIAAMRCYAASKLGDEVEIPDALRCTVSGAL